MKRKSIFQIMFFGLLIGTFLMGCSSEEDTPTTYNVTFLNNGEEYAIKEVKNGRVDLPIAPYLEGYKFLGWYSNNTVFTNENIIENMTLKAQYELINYKLVIDENNSGIVKSYNYNVESNFIYDSTPSKLGYQFMGWRCNESTTLVNKINIPKGSTGTQVCVASYINDTHTLAFEIDQNASLNIDTNLREVAHGNTISFDITKDEGYEEYEERVYLEYEHSRVQLTPNNGVYSFLMNNDSIVIVELFKEELPPQVEEKPTLAMLYSEAVKSTVLIKASNNNSTQIGSGVVYKEDGNYAYILTNAHVLSTSNGILFNTNIEVTFSNNIRVKGTYIYADKNEDIGVIRVDKSNNYTLARIVSSDNETKIGEEVFSIGNPHGNMFAITSGVISHTRIKTSTQYISNNNTTTYVFNSTATINPGNSGGAMFNSNGEVIAINTMHPNDTSYRNYNYSIPINYFIKVADYIIENKTNYTRATLDITGNSICQYSLNQLSTLGILVKQGVYVASSENIDLIERIITHVNGIEISTIDDFNFELLKYSRNDTIRLTTVDKYGYNLSNVSVVLK